MSLKTDSLHDLGLQLIAGNWNSRRASQAVRGEQLFKIYSVNYFKE